MDFVEAWGILKEIISWVSNKKDEEERKAQMSRLIGSTENLTRIAEGMQSVIKDLLDQKTLEEANAVLTNANSEFADFQSPQTSADDRQIAIQNADNYAADAATRFMEPSVKYKAASSFLAAAGAHILILTEWVKTNPGKLGKLKERAKLYHQHAESLLQGIEDLTSNRIEIVETVHHHFPDPPLPPRHEGGRQLSLSKLPHLSQLVIFSPTALRPTQEFDTYHYDYKIDGVVVASTEQNNSALAYFQAKKARDTKTLSAPITLTLRMAAETWQGIERDYPPIYAAVFDKVIITTVSPDPLTPWAISTNGAKIGFAVAKCALHFSKIIFPVPFHVYASIEDAGYIYEGAKFLSAPNRPGCFIISGGSKNGELLGVSDMVVVADNNSRNTTIDGIDWDQYQRDHGVFAYLTTDGYDNP